MLVGRHGVFSSSQQIPGQQVGAWIAADLGAVKAVPQTAGLRTGVIAERQRCPVQQLPVDEAVQLGVQRLVGAEDGAEAIAASGVLF
ncbi:MAG: hypothetical protein WBN89_12875 [Prochlorococcaceae cyanobacterium]